MCIISFQPFLILHSETPRTEITTRYLLRAFTMNTMRQWLTNDNVPPSPFSYHHPCLTTLSRGCPYQNMTLSLSNTWPSTHITISHLLSCNFFLYFPTNRWAWEKLQQQTKEINKLHLHLWEISTANLISENFICE